MGDAATVVFECRFRSAGVSVGRRLDAGGEATVWAGTIRRGGRRFDAAIKFVHADLPPDRLDEFVGLVSQSKVSVVPLASDTRLTAQAIRHGQLRQFRVQSALPRALPGLAAFLDYGLMRVQMADDEWHSCGFLATRLVRTMARSDARHPSRNARAAVRCAAEVCSVLRCLSTRRGTDRLITHGDLTPNNVLVDRRGRAVLIDFGASELARDEPDPQISTRLMGRFVDSRGQVPASGSTRSEAAAPGRGLPRPAARWLPPERSGVLRTLSTEQEQSLRPAWDVYGVGMLLAEWLLPEDTLTELRRASPASADGQSRSAMMHLDALLARIVRALARGTAASWSASQRVQLAELLGEIVLSEPVQRPALSETGRRLRALLRAPRATRRTRVEPTLERARAPLVWSACHAALDSARYTVRTAIAGRDMTSIDAVLESLHDGAAIWKQARSVAGERGVEPSQLLRYCERACASYRVSTPTARGGGSAAYIAAVEFGVALLAKAPRYHSENEQNLRIIHGIRALMKPASRSRVQKKETAQERGRRAIRGSHRRLAALLQWHLQSRGGVGIQPGSLGDEIDVLLSLVMSAAARRRKVAERRERPPSKRAR